MEKTKLLTAVSSLTLGLIYISGFVYFGALWSYPHDGSELDQLNYLKSNQFSISAVFSVIYILFGVVLSVLVLVLSDMQRGLERPFLAKLATLFGSVWIGFVIASGMIAVIGLNFVITLSATDASAAFEIWRIVMLMTESLGGGNELVGGLWVLLISLCLQSNALLPKGVNYLGVFVGLMGIGTLYPNEIFTELFGVSQILWFIWLAIHLLISANKRRDSLV